MKTKVQCLLSELVNPQQVWTLFSAEDTCSLCWIYHIARHVWVRITLQDTKLSADESKVTQPITGPRRAWSYCEAQGNVQL